MSTPCGRRPVLHLEPCCREEGHDPPCWPWAQIEFGGAWRVTVVNANEDLTAGPLALKAEVLGGPATLEDLHAHVVALAGYPELGLSGYSS